MRITLLVFLALTIMPTAMLTAQEEAMASVSEVNQPKTTQPEESSKPDIDLSKLTVEEKKNLVFDAINSRDVEQVEPLLNSSVYYLRNEAGETILTQAIFNGDKAMVKLLVKNAVSNYKNTEGETPLTLALKLGSLDIANIVLSRAKPSLKNEQ